MERENPRLQFTDAELTPELERYAKRAERAADIAEKARARIEKGRKKVKRRMVIQNAAGVGRDKAGPVQPERPKTEHIPSKEESDPLFGQTGQPAVSKTFEDEQILHFEKAERTAPIYKQHHDVSGSQRENAKSGSEEKHRSFEETSQPEPASPVKEKLAPPSKLSYDAETPFSETEDFGFGSSDAKRPSRDKADQSKRRKSNLHFEETGQSRTAAGVGDRKDRKGLNFEDADKAARRSKLRHDAENATAAGSASAVPPKAGKSKQAGDGLSPVQKPHGHAAAALAAAPLRAVGRRVHQEIAENEDDNVGLESVHKLEKSAETSGRLLTHSSRSRKLRLSASSKERQFLTVTSRKGNYFYLVIDRANDGSENVHLLNQVDEADLLPLIESKEEEAAPAACSCTEKCYVGAVNTACEICAANMAGCVGKEPEPEPEPASEPEPVKKGGVSVLSIVLVVLLTGVGAVYILKFRKKKPDTRGNDDLDEYDYGDEDDDLEDSTESEEDDV